MIDMKRTPYAALMIVLAAAGCAIGPGFHRPQTDPPAAYRPPGTKEDSLRPAFDSLAASRDSLATRKRDSDEVTHSAVAVAQSKLDFKLTDTSANISWFDLFQDTVLTQLVETALRQNRDVRIAVATIEEYRADLGQATGPLFPQISATGQSGREKQSIGKFQVTPGGPFLTIPPQNYLLAQGNVSWELDFWGRLRNTRTAARADLLAEEQSRRSVVLSLVGQVAGAYLELRELDLNLEIAQRTLASRQETFDLASQRFNRGLISELDVRQFQGDVGDAASAVASYEKQVAQKENQLSVLLGHQPGSIPRGKPLTEVMSSVDIPVSVPSTLLERRPDVRQAEAQYRGATARVGTAIGNRLPVFAITGNWGFENFDQSRYFPRGQFTEEPYNQVYQIYAGVTIPLFTGGSLFHAQKAAEARRTESRYNYEKTVLNALSDVNNQLAEVRSDRQQVVALQAEVQALRVAYQLSKDRYNAGYSAYLDVLTAELSLTQAEYSSLVGVVSLYQSLGGGWPVPGYQKPAGN
jgi:outer membrane protein, multidrug efflux system